MIVVCSACSTRFRVADEKVGPRGARLRCSRCGETFTVGPSSATPDPSAPPLPPASTPDQAPPHFQTLARMPEPDLNAEGGYPVAPDPPGGVREVTATGRTPLPDLGGAGDWPDEPHHFTGVSIQDILLPPERPPSDDPFAVFAAKAAAPETLPPPPPPEIGDPLSYLGSLPEAEISELERTGSISIAPSTPPEPPPFTAALSLEDREAPVVPPREAYPTWDRQAPSTQIAVGDDGVQEVDLSSGEYPPTGDFEVIDEGGTQEIPVAQLQPVVPGAVPGPAGVTPEQTTPGAVVGAAIRPTPPAPSKPATSAVPVSGDQAPRRLEHLAGNILSLAAILLVALGIVLWWSGEGLSGLLPWARGGRAGVEVGHLSSGVYEGLHGRPIVYVRGTVRAAKEPVEGPVRVRLVLERDGAQVAEATAAAGVEPSAADLAGARDPSDLLRIRKEVDGRAVQRMEPGGSVPFLVFLAAPEGEVRTLRYRVEALPSRGP